MPLIALLAGSGDAMAHAQLLGSTPMQGAVSATAPAEIKLTFNEPVNVLALTLVAPDGGITRLPPASTTTATVVAALPQTGEGTRVLIWRVLSDDGHPVGGSISFSVGRPTSQSIDVVTIDPIVEGLLWLGRIGLTIALFGGVGGAVFAALIDPDRRAPRWTRQVAAGSALALAILVPITLLVEGLDRLGASPRLELLPIALTAGLKSPFATSAGWDVGAGLLALLALTTTGHRSRAAALAAWLAAASAFATSGHVATAPGWMMRPAIFLHALALIFWLGALPPLLGLAAGRSTDLAAAIRRFVRLAAPLLGALVLSGVIMAVVQVEAPSELLSSNYGWILLAKLVLAAGLFALACINRFRLGPALIAAQGEGIAAFRRSVRWEIALAAAILVLAAGWRLTPPPRALLAADRAGLSVHLHEAAAMADITLVPGRAGNNQISLGLLTGDFGPLTPQKVRLHLSRADTDQPAIESDATLKDDGRWHSGTVTLPTGGRWILTIVAIHADTHQDIVAGPIGLRP